MQEHFRLPQDQTEQRLDRVLAAELTGRSRSKLQQWIRAGRVRVGGEVVTRPSHPVGGGAEVSVDPPPEDVATDAAGEPVEELVVLWEDRHLAVIDKPAGVVTHPNERYPRGTVADLARERWGALPTQQGEDRPGIVHRLDRMTSGLLILALSEEAMVELMRAFREREVEKTYSALVHGVPRFDSEWIDAPILRVPRRERLRVGGSGEEGRPASTLIECRERFHGFAHIHAHPKTGRTHQIRVHLEHLGHPIIGDRLYGPRGALEVPLPPEAPCLLRQALHARSLRFRHPISGDPLAFDSPLPADMAALLEWLRSSRPAS